jgi:DNA-binding CsgD family transcriptional regulator/tetratricopeptide (TPR) repeat protein
MCAPNLVVSNAAAHPSNPPFVPGRMRRRRMLSDRMATQATPGNEALDIRAGGASAPRAHQAGIQGRESELRLIGARLGELAAGSGSVIVVEGGSGIGKTRLLLEAVRDAKRRGMRFGVSMAEPAERAVELAALLGALFDGREPLLDRSALPSIRAEPGQRFWLLRDLEVLLERAAAAGPLVIVIDDARWADSGTAVALRTLTRSLAESAIGWLIGWRPSPESAPDAASAIEHLKRAGATVIRLGPLDEAATARLAAELLGGQPDEHVLELVEQAAGSPYLLVETLLGLQEEDRIRIVDGRAEVLDRRLPDRVRSGMRERLGRLSRPASEAVTVAASLGRTFTFAELAETLGWQPSTMLGPVAELLETNLLVERGERLAFWHDITRGAVRETIAASARRALDRWAAEVLLRSGALPVEVATQLAASAESGDEVAVATLLDAAKTLMATDSRTAAEFGRRALEISPSHHPLRGEIVSTTAIALHIAGNSDDAIAFADRALRETFPPAQEAEVRLSIAGMFAISPEIRISAGRLALGLREVPDVLRARHLASLYHNLVTSGRPHEARAMQAEADAAIGPTGDVRALFTLHLAESAVEYAEDDFGAANELVERADREGIDAGDDQRLRLAHMWRGEILSVLDAYADAFVVAGDGLEAAKRDRQGWAYQMFETWRGRLLFQSGQLRAARATLEARFADEDGSHAMAVLDAAGVAALARLAIHSGDARQIRRLTDAAHVVFETGTPAVRGHAAWVLALFASAQGDRASAHRWSGALDQQDGPSLLPRFPVDVTDEVHLARIALAVGDNDLAGRTLATVRRRLELNPGVKTIAAVEAQVSGLVEERLEDLERSVALFEESPRRLALGSALEDYGRRLTTVDRAAGITVLGRALELYLALDADWDARRVRGRLADLGVRRRIVSTRGHGSGLASLTGAEAQVARLASDGSTNREIADRLFLSPHTVNSHLRHIFTKLSIKTRTELARIVAEEDGDRPAPGPAGQRMTRSSDVDLGDVRAPRSTDP